MFDGYYSGNDIAALQRDIMRHRDRVFSETYSRLANAGHCEETMFVFLGDHGVSPIARDISVGVAAGRSCSWVPFFIYNSPLGVGVTDRLISLDDFPRTIMGLLFPDWEWRYPAPPFSGVDAVRNRRDFAFVQNKFTLQNEKARPFETKKSYAVTDGAYYLTATSFDRTPGSESAMELRVNRNLSDNDIDLLEILELDAKGNVVDIDFTLIARQSSPWFCTVYNPESLIGTIERYQTLRARLKEYVEEKERLALEKTKSAAKYTFPRESFAHSAAGLRKENFPDRRRVGKGVKWLVDMDRTLLLYGAGPFGGQVLKILRYFGGVVAGFMDSSSALHGTEAEGLRVYAPSEAVEAYPDAVVLTCLRTGENEKTAADVCGNIGLEHYSYALDAVGVHI